MLLVNAVWARTPSESIIRETVANAPDQTLGMIISVCILLLEVTVGSFRLCTSSNRVVSMTRYFTGIFHSPQGNTRS